MNNLQLFTQGTIDKFAKLFFPASLN